MRQIRNNFKPRGNCDCISGMIRQIIKAQDTVAENHCTTSCDTSIQQLMAQKSGHDLGPNHTTIPFMLYSANTAKPYFGQGFFNGKDGGGAFYECIQSPIFKAKHFSKNSECCVTLELLLPVDEQRNIQFCYDHNVCDSFPADCPITDFLETGICITVDLEHFMGITCLDPVRPIHAHEVLSSSKHQL